MMCLELVFELLIWSCLFACSVSLNCPDLKARRTLSKWKERVYVHPSLPALGLNFLLGIPAERLRSLGKRCSLLTGLACSNDWCTIAVHSTEAKTSRASPPPPTVPPFLSVCVSLCLLGWHTRRFAKKLSVCLHCVLNDMSVGLLNSAALSCLLLRVPFLSTMRSSACP